MLAESFIPWFPLMVTPHSTRLCSGISLWILNFHSYSPGSATVLSQFKFQSMLYCKLMKQSNLLFFHSLPDITSHTNKLEAIFCIFCPTFNGQGTTYTFYTLYLLLDHLITVDALKTGFSRICTFLLCHFLFHVSSWQLLSSTAGSSLPWRFSVLCPCWLRSVKCAFLNNFNQLKWWKTGSDCGLHSSGMWHRILGSNILWSTGLSCKNSS